MKLKQLVENDVTDNKIHSLFYNAIENKKRNYSLEQYIVTVPWMAYEYARDVINGVWPEAEQYIMLDPQYAYYYTLQLLKTRWPEAEPYIFTNEMYANCYLQDWPEARTLSKDVPLAIGSFAITDVPNTITDEQLMKLIKILDPSTTISQETLVSFRKYFEPRIKELLHTNKLVKITTKQILNNEKIRTGFLKYINITDNDFE